METANGKKREKEIYKVTIVGSIVNFGLVLFKFIAGIVGNSAAMIADAVHSLSDFVTDVIIIIFVKISNKPQDKEHDYGHGKFETLATTLIGLILLFVGLGIAWNGVSGIITVAKGGVLESPGKLALIAAIISIIFKELLYQYTVIQGKKLKSEIIVANAWHHRSDALSSVATAIGVGGAILLGSKWNILDPIAALFVSILIVKTAISLIKPSVDELMEQSLPQNVEVEIEDIIKSHPQIQHMSELHSRKIGNYSAIEFNIQMDGKMSLSEAHKITSEIEQQIIKKHGTKTHITIHMEPV